jgi:hypothetical protein
MPFRDDAPILVLVAGPECGDELGVLGVHLRDRTEWESAGSPERGKPQVSLEPACSAGAAAQLLCHRPNTWEGTEGTPELEDASSRGHQQVGVDHRAARGAAPRVGSRTASTTGSPDSEWMVAGARNPER